MVIVHPLSRRLSAGRAMTLIAVTWVVAVFVAVPNLIYADVYTWHFDDGSERTVCFIDWPHKQIDLASVSFILCT